MDPFLLVLVLFGCLTGMLSGLLGVGGGLFMVPFLVIVGGLNQQEGQATSLLVVLPTAIIATWALHRRGIGDVGIALKMGVAGIAGSVLSAWLALQLPGSVLRVIFAVVLAVIALRLFRDALRPAPG